MKNKKILRICHKFLNGEDGYSITIKEQVELLKNCFEQHIITFIKKESLKEYIQKNHLIKKKNSYYSKKYNSHIIPLTLKENKNLPLINNFFLKKNILLFKKELKKQIERINPEFIQIHGTLIPQFLTAAKEGKKLNKKIIIMHHGGKINKKINQNVKIRLKKFLIHNSFPLIAEKVICLSDQGRTSFIFKKNIDIFQGIKKLKLQKSKKEKGNKISFIYPSRICEQKNQLKLIKAFSKLKSKELELKIIGRCHDKKYLEKIKKEIKKSKLKENIHILKEQPHQEILKEISNSNFLIFPSLTEGQGRICLEAIELGTFVICSKRIQKDNEFLLDENSLSFNPKRKNSIIKAIQKALEKKRKLKTTRNKPSKEYFNKLKNIYN